MKNLGMAFLNYARGGDIKKANQVRIRFEKLFPGKDLYLPNRGDSLVETMRLLTSEEPMSTGQIRVSNAGRALKAELRRVNWNHN